MESTNLEPGEHSAPGGVVHRTGLKPREGKIVRLKCGCSSDDSRWLTFCDAVWKNSHKHHSAAMEAHILSARKAADPLLE